MSTLTSARAEATQVPSLPNPYTSLAWLEPTAASQFEASRYIVIASISAYTWDWLASMSDEYRMIRKAKRSLPVSVYCLSRVAAMAYLVSSTIFLVGSVDSCAELQTALGWCFACTVSASAALFYFRVKAVFLGNYFIAISFAILWLGVTAGCILVPFAISGEHIGTTDYCINSKVLPYSSAGIVMNTCYDALIFISISWRLLQNHQGQESRMKAFTSGKSLPRFTRSVMQSGQLYFLVTVGVNILTTVTILSPALPPVLHAMFTMPNAALENAMATRVFRAVALGTIKDAHSTTEHTTSKLSNFLWGSSEYSRSSGERNPATLDHGIALNRVKPTVNIHMSVEATSDEDSLDPKIHDLESHSNGATQLA